MRYLLLMPALMLVLGAATATQAGESGVPSDQRSWNFFQTAKSGKFDEKTLKLTLVEASPPTIAANSGSLEVPSIEPNMAADGWRDAILTFDFNGKVLKAKIKIGAATYDGTTVSYDVRLITGQLAECFDNPSMVYEVQRVAGISAVEIVR